MPNRALRGDGAASNSSGFSAFRQSLHLHPHQQTIPSSIPPELLQKKVMKSPSLSEKVAFFDQLDALDNVSDGDDEVDEKEQDHRNKCWAFFSSRKRNNPGPVQETQEKGKPKAPSHQRRTASMPTPAGATPGSRVIEATPATHNMKTRQAAGLGEFLTNTTSFVEETPVPDTTRPLPATLWRSATLPPPNSSSTMEQSPSASTALRKRKRQSSTKSIPEAAQVFRGLSFYYIPNNDIAPARNLRIGKAQDYGARWVRKLEDASHTIVDKYLEYKDIKSVLGSEVPSSLVIVNEDYPIDCISFRTLLNPDQNRYRVAGCPEKKDQLAPDKAPSSPSRSPDHSLQVKPPRTSSRRDSADTPPENGPAPLHGDAQISQRGPENQTLGGIAGSPSEAHAGQVRPAIQDNGSIEKAPPPPPPGRTSSTNDELSECIELLQQYKDLPLDTEEDDLQSAKDAHEADSNSEIEERSEDERARKRTAKTHRKGQKNIPFEERFACNRGGTKDQTTDANNPNAKTIEILQSMCDYYTRTNDTWRIMAYRKAIATLQRQPTKITTAAEAALLPNIGPRLAAKIQEIATTNRLRRLDYTHDSPLDQALALFLGVYGAGSARAHRWIAQGHRSLADLLAPNSSADLTPHQRLGVERYADLNARIPRAEVGKLFAYVQREAAAIDPGVEVLVGGSYRRGADSSGDVDVIVTRRGTVRASELVPFLEELVQVLTRKGFLVATLAALHANRAGQDGPGGKWHGCCVLPPDEEGADTNADADAGGGSGSGSGSGVPQKEPIWRRIDFLLVPEAEYGAALIYFTGNDIFNRSLRLLASKKGMRLNQRGLYKEVLRGKNRAKITEGQLLEGRDEKRIFELLGVKWREPWERWC